MNHIGTQGIETEKLFLRPFRKGDETHIFNNWASDDAITRYLTWPTHQSVETSKRVLGYWLESYQDLSNYSWGVQVKSTGELIGSIGAVNINEEESTIELGYCIGSAFAGNNYATSALLAVIDFLFRHVKANKIIGKHSLDNPASARVMEKAGMIYLNDISVGNHLHSVYVIKRQDL